MFTNNYYLYVLIFNRGTFHKFILNQKQIYFMKYVAYYRVSTKDQFLGLDAQKYSVENYCKGKGEIIKCFEEKESGKNCNRPELKKAISSVLELDSEFKLNGGCCLVIAKLDRLSRNVKFISTLMETEVEFICCDMPYANKFVIHLMAAFAEDELNRISTRTKETLKILKDKGVKLGNPYKGGEIKKDGTIAKVPFSGSRILANAAIKEKRDNNEELQRTIKIAKDLRDQGLSWAKVANKLNEYGLKTPRGARFDVSLVWQLFNRRMNSEPSQYPGRPIYH